MSDYPPHLIAEADQHYAHIPEALDHALDHIDQMLNDTTESRPVRFAEILHTVIRDQCPDGQAVFAYYGLCALVKLADQRRASRG